MHVLAVIIALPLLIGPFWTHRAFSEAETMERWQVALDNAAIVSGRAERELLSRLSKGGRELRRLELLHHPWHACALVPATQAKCIPVDQALEARIREVHAREWWLALGRWIAAAARARGEMARFGEKLCRSSRPGRLPVIPVLCPTCGMASGFAVAEGEVRYRYESCHDGVSSVEVSVKGGALVGERWEYRLAEAFP